MMSKKTTTAKVAAAIENAPEVEQNEVVDFASESNPTTEVPVASETVAEAKKRERNYSQSAINTADIERLTQLKVFVKEKLKVNVSNQRIISAALDCLGEHVESFLKGIAEDANSKQREKDQKAFEALRAKLETPTEPEASHTEAA
ncbi:hypothetical protein AUC43_15395 [Hymenobacter sedentarius]|uniref:Uncharacterized protein n=1 Tax=Hymenobacter sedentarius TaxID=1411621 RepID=A0A0U4ADU4_9BACT|nr:hypothetical protein [Hymenobacter sedentarius]ALW86348.1 hypothetical protein AUC43_15395 [Hymenobacter sedentarius]